MKKDKWITPDDYHFQDILDNGRCVWCGRLASKNTKGSHRSCDEHKEIIELLAKS